MASRFLIVEADFYPDIAAAQKQGAIKILKEVEARYEVITVPGALEIPAAIAVAEAGKTHFDGYIALACVIRGETSHYETVCSQSAYGLMKLAIAKKLAIGNGILTVENDAQAWERADMNKLDKGGAAARAAIRLAAIKNHFNNE